MFLHAYLACVEKKLNSQINRGLHQTSRGPQSFFVYCELMSQSAITNITKKTSIINTSQRSRIYQGPWGHIGR